jgi:hypothetical protein
VGVWATSTQPGAVGVWATSTQPGAVGGSPIAAAATSTSSGGWRSTAALVLDVAQELQELGGLAVGGGDGEPANHVLEAGERALVAVVASPRSSNWSPSSRPRRPAAG